MEEVRFDYMAPAAVVARREACNLAYLAVGVLEWHGPHLPFGTDYLIGRHIAEQAARCFGGVAFPPLYYSDVRYHLHDCRREWRRSYSRAMKVPETGAALFGLEYTECYGAPAPFPPDDGAAPDDPLPFGFAEMERDFSRQIARALLEIHLYGFRRILLLPSHGPNPAYCRRAVDIYRRNVPRRKALGTPAETAIWFWAEAAKETEPLLKNHWIHADKWETSCMLVIAPESVRLEALRRDRREIVPAYLGAPYITETDGYNPEQRPLWPSFAALDPRNASAEYGREQLAGVLLRLGREVERLIRGPDLPG